MYLSERCPPTFMRDRSPLVMLLKIDFKLFIMANHTHTWWHNITPLSSIYCHETFDWFELKSLLF